jgi:hypothetical protein
MSDGARLAELGARFAHQANQAHREHSPLYERLARGVAEDREMLTLAAHARSTPESSLLLTAAHYLLLGGEEGAVAAFYPSVVGEARGEGDPYPLFRDFCLEHAEEIRTLISTRRVQQNEVRRCAQLLPAFGLVAERVRSPLALVEVGASAGLNLLFDRYAYDYGDGRLRGDTGSPVRLACGLRGDRVPPLPDEPPAVAWRVGLDLNPLDIRDPEAARWLEALIWPEEYAHGAPRLRHAVSVAEQEPPTLLAGDALDLLPEALAAVPEGASPCVFHTFTLNQISDEGRQLFSTILAEHARERDIHRVSIEWLGADDSPLLRLSRYTDGAEEDLLLARCDDLGEWLEWLGS